MAKKRGDPPGTARGYQLPHGRYDLLVEFSAADIVLINGMASRLDWTMEEFVRLHALLAAQLFRELLLLHPLEGDE